MMLKRLNFTRFITALAICTLLVSAAQPVPKPKAKSQTSPKAPAGKAQPTQKAPAKAKSQVKKKPDLVKKTPVRPVQKDYLVEISTRFGVMIARLYNETPLHRDNFVKLVKDSFYNDLLFHRAIPDFMIQGGDPTSRYADTAAILGNGGPGYTIPAEILPNLFHKPGVLAAARDNNPDKASSGSQFYIVQGKLFPVDELLKIQNQYNLKAKRELLTQITKSDSVQARMNDFMMRGDKEGMNAYFRNLQPVVDKLFEPKELRFTSEQYEVYTRQGGAPFLDRDYTVFGEVISGFNVIDSVAAQKTGKFDRPLEDVRMRIRLVN